MAPIYQTSGNDAQKLHRDVATRVSCTVLHRPY